MQLEILSPTKSIFSGTVDEVTLPSEMGEIGILPGHARMIAIVKPGTLTWRGNGQANTIVLADGFIEVDQTRVIVYQRITSSFLC